LFVIVCGETIIKKIEKKLNSFNALIKMIVFKFVCSTEVSLRMSEMTK